MEGGVSFEGPRDLNLKATELRLGLPGTDHEDECDHHHQTQKPALNVRMNNKRPLVESDELAFSKKNSSGSEVIHGDPETETAPAPSKQQVVGWPPIRSYRKNSFQPKKNESSSESSGGIYVKVSMDGAPYLRKIDLKMYKGYPDLLKALENMFKFTIGQYSEREGYNGSEYAPTYEDKDGDWMLVGDVPWEMFISSCKKLRIMKGSEARGLGCGV